MKNIFYTICNLLNIISTFVLIAVLFYDPKNLVSIKVILFLMWLNVTTHITSRTRNIQKL